MKWYVGISEFLPLPAVFNSTPDPVKEFIYSALRLKALQQLYTDARGRSGEALSQNVLDTLQVAIEVSNTHERSVMPASGTAGTVYSHRCFRSQIEFRKRESCPAGDRLAAPREWNGDISGRRSFPLELAAATHYRWPVEQLGGSMRTARESHHRSSVLCRPKQPLVPGSGIASSKSTDGPASGRTAEQAWLYGRGADRRSHRV